MTARAGEHALPGETVVGEEAEVTEAIHAAAHPGRASKADADTQAEEAGADDASADESTKAGGRGDPSATTDDASGDEQRESTVEAAS